MNKRINRYKKRIKKLSKKVRRRLTILFYNFFHFCPIKPNKVLFFSDQRAELGGNMKCLYDVMDQEKYQVICILRANTFIKRTFAENVRLSYHLATSQYIILDDWNRATSYMDGRPGQEIVQLWHGTGAFKTFGYSRSDRKKSNQYGNHRNYTRAIVTSESIRWCYAEGFGMNIANVYASGFPRTDVFFDEEYINNTRRDFFNRYPDLKGRKIVLFAPTYRGENLAKCSYDFDMLDLDRIGTELGSNYAFIIKWHPAIQDKIKIGELSFEIKTKIDTKTKNSMMPDRCIFLNLSEEREINDLLMICDLLITDYSSVIFDYSLLNKPIVYYTYDLNTYDEKRGFYFDIKEYIYGACAFNMNELISCIKNPVVLQDEHERFVEKFMYSCDGHCTERVYREIFEEKKCDVRLSVYGREFLLPHAADVDPADKGDPNEILVSEKNGIEALTRDLVNISDCRLCDIRGLSQYKILDLLNIRHGREIIMEANLNAGQYIFEGIPVLDLRSKTMMRVRSYYVRDDALNIEGIIRLGSSKRSFSLYAVTTDGLRYSANIYDYHHDDLIGLGGNIIRAGQRFHYKIPLQDAMEIAFFVKIENIEIRMNPYFDRHIGLGKAAEGYAVRDGIISHYKNDMLSVRRDTTDVRKALDIPTATDGAALIERVAFVTARSEGELTGNLRKVYDALNIPKIMYARKGLGHDRDALAKATDIITSSRVVVTDDYLVPFRYQGKRPGQSFVQLWHAAGAAKKFGLDGSNLLPGEEYEYHRGYDLVTVSAEGVRDIYANAFGITRDKVIATGIARTDDLFDDNYYTSVEDRVNCLHPELESRNIILYAPTFRDVIGNTRAHFSPDIDFDKVSEALRGNKVLVICPHPVMSEPILDKKYDNVFEIRDVSTADMMIVSDVLITDYSSVMFEYALLGKPMAFYCSDLADYDRDFYLDYNTELPGQMLKTNEELISYIEQEEYPKGNGYYSFLDKYMSACDGHSTNRITSEIGSMLKLGAKAYESI